jgi:hypothetical protein
LNFLSLIHPSTPSNTSNMELTRESAITIGFDSMYNHNRCQQSGLCIFIRMTIDEREVSVVIRFANKGCIHPFVYDCEHENDDCNCHCKCEGVVSRIIAVYGESAETGDHMETEFDLNDEAIANTMICGYDVLLNIHSHICTLPKSEESIEFLEAKIEELRDVVQMSVINADEPSKTSIILKRASCKSSRH